MPNEDIVLDGYAFAYKGMAGDLAVFAYGGVFLDFYKGANLGVIADGAAVEVDEVGELYVMAEFDVVRY